MEIEIKPIGNKEIEETINKLKKDYGVSTECLTHLLRVKGNGDKIEITTEFQLRLNLDLRQL